MALTSMPAPTATAKDLSEPRLKNPPLTNESCDSLAVPIKTCANGETFLGRDTCGPKRNA